VIETFLTAPSPGVPELPVHAPEQLTVGAMVGVILREGAHAAGAPAHRVTVHIDAPLATQLTDAVGIARDLAAQWRSALADRAQAVRSLLSVRPGHGRVDVELVVEAERDTDGASAPADGRVVHRVSIPCHRPRE